jgi:hypothetical protein
MRSDDLLMLYRELRRALDAAYAIRPWDGERIDCIAADLLRLERTLAMECVDPMDHLPDRPTSAWAARAAVTTTSRAS